MKESVSRPTGQDVALRRLKWQFESAGIDHEFCGLVGELAVPVSLSRKRSPVQIRSGPPCPHRLDGLGYIFLKDATRVRIPLGTPKVMLEIDQDYNTILSAEAGDLVWDDLEGRNTRIVRISRDESGNLGYWLASDWINGGRFPWEISSPRQFRDCWPFFEDLSLRD